MQGVESLRLRGGEGAGGEVGEGLPTWEEARSTRVSTTRHVPKAARAKWTRTLGAVVSEVLDGPENTNSWLKLYILAHCVLQAKPGEQGATGDGSVAKRVKDACVRWQAGHCGQLWAEATGGEKVQKRGRKRRLQPPWWRTMPGGPGLSYRRASF